jgi:haloalkane dehalogenase
MTLEAFTGLLASFSKGIGPEDAREYFKAFADEPRRRGQLELYRSGEWEKLEAYDGALAALGVPFLALWGEDDPFAPVAGAQRFARERAGGGDVRVQVIPGTGHFVYDDAPETAAEALASFLAEAAPR